MDSHTLTVDVGGWSLVGELTIVNKDSSHCLVCTHSLLYPSTIMFRGFGRRLVKVGMNLLLLDLPGHGKSGVPVGEYALEHVAYQVANFLDYLTTKHGFTVFDHVGLSMGGMVALRLSLLRPELVNRLVLMSTSATAENNPIFGQLTQTVEQLPDMSEKAAWAVAGQIYPMLFGRDDAKFRDAQLGHLVRLMRDPQRRMVAAANAVFGRTDLDVATLSHITCPAWVYWFRSDRSRTKKEAAQMFDWLPNSQIMRALPGGHLAPMEDPETIAKHVALDLA